MATSSAVDNHPTDQSANLPIPHRCPWLMQYFLVCPLRRLLEPPRKLLHPHVKPGMTVLEPGCGMGYFSLPIARMVGPQGRVLCVDVEPRAVERLKQRAKRAGLGDRITTITCGPLDLGLDDYTGQIDLAVVFYSLHEFNDLPGFLDQVRRLLTPEGKMLVLEPRDHVNPQQFEAMMDCCKEHGLRLVDRLHKGNKRLAALLARD